MSKENVENAFDKIRKNKLSFENVLVKAIVDMLLFFENAVESEVDPDIAVEVLEQVAHIFGGLGEEEVNKLKKILNVVSDQYDGADQVFVKNICDNFGLLSC